MFTAFLAVSIICAVLSLLVPVNYNMVDYLPKDAQSTTAIKIIKDEFEGELPNAKVMLTNVSIIVVPAFLAQSNTEFLYGTGVIANASRIGKDNLLIEEKFGGDNMLALLVPKEEPGKEISGEDLGGKSGALKILVSVKQNKKVNSTFFNNYALQITLSLDSRLCSA